MVLLKQPLPLRISPILRHKAFWQVIIALLMLALGIFFIRNQRLELASIRTALSEAHTVWVGMGALLSLGYLAVQGWLYVVSFRTLHLSISWTSAVVLFLRRNLISVFLPAGGFSSLAFFTRPLKEQGLTATQIYYGSLIFAAASMASVIVVAIPALLYLLLQDNLHAQEVWAFASLLVFVAMLGAAGYSLLHQGRIYQWVVRYRPEWVVALEELRSQSFNKENFARAIGVSMLIEGIGIMQIYTAILALDITARWEAAVVAYIVMVILLVASPVLRGLGAIEVSMSFVLVQYGYSTVAAAAVTLLFRFFEFWLPLIAGIVSFFTKKDHILYRVLPALLSLLLGVVNIASAITPAIPERLRAIESILPVGVVYASNFAVLVVGLTLCLLSVYLLMGRRNAWKLAVLLASLSLIGHLTKAIDYEEALVALFTLFVLTITRQYYHVRQDIAFQQQHWGRIAVVFAAVLLYGMVGFYFLQPHHFGKDFTLIRSFEALMKTLFLFDDRSLMPLTPFGRYFIYSIDAAGAALIAYTIYMIFRAANRPVVTLAADRLAAQALIAQYGQSGLDFFKIYPDKQLFFNQSRDCFLAYRIAHHYAVVLEDPVGPPSKITDTLMAFSDYCTHVGLRSFFYRVPENSLPWYAPLQRRKLLIGQEALLDLSTFTLQGGERKALRNAISKTEKTGYQVKVYEPPLSTGLLQKLQQVSDEWLGGRHEIVFTQGRFHADELRQETVLTVEDAEGRVVAFANMIPHAQGSQGSYDMMRKTEDAPNGTLDYLMVKAFEYLKSQGYRQVNMGLAPMAVPEATHNVTERAIHFASENLKALTRFKGLYAYKNKYHPRWENRYLLYENTYDLLQFPKVLQKVSQLPADAANSNIDDTA